MGRGNILDVSTSVQEFAYLHVVFGIALSRGSIVVFVGKKADRAQNQAGQALLPMNQLTQLLGRKLRDAVNVLRDRHHLFRDPRRRLSCRWHERAAERARSTRVHKGLRALRRGGLEQIQSAADVRIDELLTRMCPDVGLVESGRMQDHADALHAVLDKSAVRDGSDVAREWRALDIEADAFVAGGGEDSHECFPQMTGAAACDKNPHRSSASDRPPSLLANASAARTAWTKALSLSQSSRPSVRTPEHRSIPNGRTRVIASTML